MKTEHGNISVSHGDISPEFDALIRASRFSAWDIETDGLDFRRDTLRTCQIFVPDHGVEVVQIDPGFVPQRLTHALASDRVFKLFHHAMFDLRFMRYQWDVRPRNVGCTKIASKIALPERRTHSLAGLVKDFLGISLDKSQQRSDWSSDNLTDEQIRYAANDTLFLPKLLEELLRQARNRGVAELIENSFDYIPVRVETDLRDSGDIFSY